MFRVIYNYSIIFFLTYLLTSKAILEMCIIIFTIEYVECTKEANISFTHSLTRLMA